MVVCRTDGAVIERVDAPFAAECAKYYVELEQVADLLEHCRDVLKLAIFDFGEAAVSTQRYFSGLDQQVVVSGKHWIDIMDRDANKGHGVRALQEALGVTAARTVAFGDYLNDVEMLGAADHSYAVANAHPDVAAVGWRGVFRAMPRRAWSSNWSDSCEAAGWRPRALDDVSGDSAAVADLVAVLVGPIANPLGFLLAASPPRRPDRNGRARRCTGEAVAERGGVLR